jgi:tripartite-type tricarboxylate transporter receptor subunit TctC
MGFRVASGILGLVALAASVCAASAQSPADFYRGRTVTLLVGSGVGGGYDAYSRTLARYWPKHIPGSPNMVVQNMPGANGVTMMNNLANAAPKDGSVIGSAFAANVIEPVIDQGRFTKFDSRELNWLGNIAPQYNGCFVRKDSAIKTLEDAMKTETLISATGANSNSAVMANVYNTLIGAKFKVIMGYSTAEQTLAIERKEVDGTCVSYDNLLTSQPGMIERNLITWLIVLNDKPVAELPGTPPATQFARSEQERQMLKLLIARNVLGRPYVVAKGVPEDRIAALRTSFMRTMSDPEFLDEAKKLRMTVAPVDHAAMEKMIAEVYAVPQDVVQKTMQLTKEN